MLLYYFIAIFSVIGWFNSYTLKMAALAASLKSLQITAAKYWDQSRTIKPLAGVFCVSILVCLTLFYYYPIFPVLCFFLFLLSVFSKFSLLNIYGHSDLYNACICIISMEVLTKMGKMSRCVCACVRACMCVFAVVSGCHVNHSGSLSLSIIASCCGNDTQPGFDITTDEWHFTQVCVTVRALLCVCIILCVIAFSFPDVSCFESYIYKTTTVSLCVPVCVPSDNFLCVCVYLWYACTESLILNTALQFLQSLSSLFPVFLHISALYRVENPELQIWMEFVIILFIYRPRYFCPYLPHSIYCCFCLPQYALLLNVHTWNLDCSHLPGPVWTQAMTQTPASNESEGLVRFPQGGRGKEKSRQG